MGCGASSSTAADKGKASGEVTSVYPANASGTNATFRGSGPLGEGDEKGGLFTAPHPPGSPSHGRPQPLPHSGSSSSAKFGHSSASQASRHTEDWVRNFTPAALDLTDDDELLSALGDDDESSRRSSFSSVSVTRNPTMGTYTLMDVVGRGTFGVVWSCYSKASDELYAMKICPQDRVGGRFHTEIDILRRCDHPGIVKIFEVVKDKKSISLVLEHLGGGPLVDEMNPILPEEVARKYFKQVCSAVQYLHGEGIVHGDIKPDNIICDVAGDTCKMVDFGSASLDGEKLSRRNTNGTPAFCPPEATSGEVVSGFAADVWALGLTLYQCCVGHLPFDTTRGEHNLYKEIAEREINYPDTLSPLLTDLLTNLLQKDPRRRGTIPYASQHPWVEGKATITMMPTLSDISDWSTFAPDHSGFGTLEYESRTDAFPALIVDTTDLHIVFLNFLLHAISDPDRPKPVVHTAYSAKEASEKCCETEYRLIVMDLNLYPTNGVNALVNIRANEKELKRSHSVIIGVTGPWEVPGSGTGLAPIAFHCGVNDTIRKPYRSDALWDIFLSYNFHRRALLDFALILNADQSPAVFAEKVGLSPEAVAVVRETLRRARVEPMEASEFVKEELSPRVSGRFERTTSMNTPLQTAYPESPLDSRNESSAGWGASLTQLVRERDQQQQRHSQPVFGVDTMLKMLEEGRKRLKEELDVEIVPEEPPSKPVVLSPEALKVQGAAPPTAAMFELVPEFEEEELGSTTDLVLGNIQKSEVERSTWLQEKEHEEKDRLERFLLESSRTKLRAPAVTRSSSTSPAGTAQVAAPESPTAAGEPTMPAHPGLQHQRYTNKCNYPLLEHLPRSIFKKICYSTVASVLYTRVPPSLQLQAPGTLALLVVLFQLSRAYSAHLSTKTFSLPKLKEEVELFLDPILTAFVIHRHAVPADAPGWNFSFEQSYGVRTTMEDQFFITTALSTFSEGSMDDLDERLQYADKRFDEVLEILEGPAEEGKKDKDTDTDKDDSSGRPDSGSNSTPLVFPPAVSSSTVTTPDEIEGATGGNDASPLALPTRTLRNGSVKGAGSSFAGGSIVGDRGSLTSESINEFPSARGGLEGGFFCGLYDGHGGDEAAIFSSMYLHSAFANELNTQIKNHPEAKQGERVSTAFVRSFHQTHNRYKKLAKEAACDAGTTALCVYFDGKTLFVANAGDSQGVLYEEKSKKVTVLNNLHNTSNKEEMKRLRKENLPVARGADGEMRVGGMLKVTRALGSAPCEECLSHRPEVTAFDMSPFLAKDEVYLASNTTKSGGKSSRGGKEEGVARAKPMPLEEGPQEEPLEGVVILGSDGFWDLYRGEDRSYVSLGESAMEIRNMIDDEYTDKPRGDSSTGSRGEEGSTPSTGSDGRPLELPSGVPSPKKVSPESSSGKGSSSGGHPPHPPGSPMSGHGRLIQIKRQTSLKAGGPGVDVYSLSGPVPAPPGMASSMSAGSMSGVGVPGPGGSATNSYNLSPQEREMSLLSFLDSGHLSLTTSVKEVDDRVERAGRERTGTSGESTSADSRSRSTSPRAGAGKKLDACLTTAVAGSPESPALASQGEESAESVSSVTGNANAMVTLLREKRCPEYKEIATFFVHDKDEAPDPNSRPHDNVTCILLFFDATPPWKETVENVPRAEE